MVGDPTAKGGEELSHWYRMAERMTFLKATTSRDALLNLILLALAPINNYEVY